MYQWDSKYSLKNELIDSEHKEFFAQINRLEELSKEELTMEHVSLVVVFLQDYARKHFTDEEAYMREHQYPDLKKHAELHNAFTNKVDEMLTEMRTNKDPHDLAKTLSNFMGNWLVAHITHVDQAIAAYIQRGERWEI